MPSLADVLARRLPAEGPILALGGAHSPALAHRPGIERRAEDDPASVTPAALEPGGWRAIVLDLERAPAPAAWPSLLAGLRRALDADGRLFVLVGAGVGADRAVASEAVGALLEARFRLVHEETVALDPGRDAPATGLVLEALPDQHVVRSYREGDETAIVRLFAESFSPDRGLDHWRWKYRDNPFGTLAISCAFGPDGELVAHYAAYPVPFRRSRAGDPETILCHQVGDTMTDRRHRHVGRGKTSLLGRTARHFYARRCDGRVAFNYGFNTGNIQRFSELFVGARKVWDIELLELPRRRSEPRRAAALPSLSRDARRSPRRRRRRFLRAGGTALRPPGRAPAAVPRVALSALPRRRVPALSRRSRPPPGGLGCGASGR